MNADDRRQMLEQEIVALTQLLETEGLWTKGSRGQFVLNPALAARRACLEALRKLDMNAPVDTGPDELEEFLNETD